MKKTKTIEKNAKIVNKYLNSKLKGNLKHFMMLHHFDNSREKTQTS
jgi:hypothetical protein